MRSRANARALGARAVLASGVAALTLALAGCGDQASPKPAAQAGGHMRLVWGVPRDRAQRAIEQLERSGGTFADLVRGVDQAFALPRDITVAWTSEQRAPYYETRRRRIVLGYPFALQAGRLFLQAGVAKSSAQAAGMAQAVSLFVFLHELSHALIAELDVPATGRQEDAADQLAVVLSTTTVPQGDTIALAAARLFDLFSRYRGGFTTQSRFWDEHLLDDQRFRQILCLLAGADPKSYASVIRRAGAPSGSTRLCVAEYARAQRAWTRLLEPHLRS